jgi:predicted amidohydrolase
MKIYHPATPSTTPPCQAKDQEISIFSGDIYTHTYHGHPGTILDREQNLISPFVIQ